MKIFTDNRKLLNIKTGKAEIVEEQIAVDMIASGQAVPHIEVMDSDLSVLEIGPVVVLENK